MSFMDAAVKRDVDLIVLDVPSSLSTGTALLGKEAAMACTVAVESVITDHYNSQIRELSRMTQETGEDHKELLEVRTHMQTFPLTGISTWARTLKQGRTHGGGEVRGERPPPLGPKEHYIFRVSFVKLRDFQLSSLFFFSVLLCGRTEEACRMIKSLRKVDFSHPTGHHTKKIPLAKILGAPLLSRHRETRV